MQPAGGEAAIGGGGEEATTRANDRIQGQPGGGVEGNPGDLGRGGDSIDGGAGRRRLGEDAADDEDEGDGGSELGHDRAQNF